MALFAALSAHVSELHCYDTIHTLFVLLYKLYLCRIIMSVFYNYDKTGSFPQIVSNTGLCLLSICGILLFKDNLHSTVK